MTEKTNSDESSGSATRPTEKEAFAEKAIEPERPTRIPIFFYAGALAFLLLVLFIVQNTQPVVVSFLIWRMEMSQIVVITISGVLGFFIGLFAMRTLSRR